jgi:hypothetical protein
LEKEIIMVFEQQLDLLARKQRLRWTNREVGNALGVSPGVASSKLNGFLKFTDKERSKLERAMSEAEAGMKRTATSTNT